MPANSSKISPPKLSSEEIWKFVVVACVVVAFTPVKFWRVEEAMVRKPPSELILNSSVPALDSALKKFPVKDAVEEALIKSPVVPVALTWN